jgi:hypothetical protein
MLIKKTREPQDEEDESKVSNGQILSNKDIISRCQPKKTTSDGGYVACNLFCMRGDQIQEARTKNLMCNEYYLVYEMQFCLFLVEKPITHLI